MSKEIITYVNDLLEKCIFDARGRSIVKNEEQILLVDKAQQIIKELTPPTEQEVCEELGKHFSKVLEGDFQVVYNKKDKTFKLKDRFRSVLWLSDGEIVLLYTFPPTLFELVGKFYRNEVNQ